MDLVFTKTSDNMVRLEYWATPFAVPSPPQLSSVRVVNPTEASRLVQAVRPDILTDFNAWLAMNF